jgi:hypothetical protein
MSGGSTYLERLPGAVEDVHVERRGPEGGVGGGVVGEAEELILQSKQVECYGEEGVGGLGCCGGGDGGDLPGSSRSGSRRSWRGRRPAPSPPPSSPPRLAGGFRAGGDATE